VLGISSAIAFNSKSKKKGMGYTWISILTRFLILFWINIAYRIFFMVIPVNTLAMREYILLSIWLGITLILIFFHFLFLKKSKLRPLVMLCWAIFSLCICYPVLDKTSNNNVFSVFFGDTLAYLAWGTLFAGLALTLIKNPDHRIWSAFGLFALHFVLWEVAKFRSITPTNWFIDVFPGTYFDVMGIPFAVINMGAIAISATCISDWLLKKYNDPKDGVKNRIIPYWIIVFCLHFITDFFQPGNHDGINTSLATISIFFGTLFLLIFYAWDTYFNIKLVFLTPLGRNSLLLFLLQTVYLLIYQFTWYDIRDFRTQFPGMLGNFLGMLVFVVPIGFLIFVAWILDKLKIYIKF
jgi:hypothetical protein